MPVVFVDCCFCCWDLLELGEVVALLLVELLVVALEAGEADSDTVRVDVDGVGVWSK